MKDLSPFVWTLLLVIQIPSVLGAATIGSSLAAEQKRLDHISGSLNISASQCDNFAEYACGGIQIFKDIYSYTYFNLQLLDRRIKNELTEAIGKLQSTSDYKFLRNIHNYRKSCHNEKNKGKILQYLKWMNVNTGIKWPMAEEIKSALPDMDWVELLAVTRKYGFNQIFVYEDITPLPEDSLKMSIELKRPPLERIFRFADLLMVEMLSADEVDKFSEFQRKLLKTTVKLFEIEGHEQLQEYAEMPGSTESSPISLKDLGLPWVNKYVQVLLDQSSVNLDMIVYVENKQYLKGLGEFLSHYDNRFLTDYIQIKFFRFLKERDAYSYMITNCEGNVRDMFPLPMQWLYKNQHPELQNELPHIRSIFGNLKATLKKSLNRNVYNFPPDIVKYLQTKIDSIELSVDAITAEALEEFYNTLSLNSTDYFGNRLKLFQLDFNITHSFISKRLSKNSLSMLSLRPAPINNDFFYQTYFSNLPYLFPRYNLIFLPMTLLQHPYYESGLGVVYSYSTIGFMLAHQIVKAFDSRYLRVDAEGRYNTTADEVIQTNRKFQANVQTLNKTLSTLRGDTFKLFADIGGLKLAHDTVHELHPDALLANVTLHGELVQMEKVFFMSFAQNYCGIRCDWSQLNIWQGYSRCHRATVATVNLDSFRDAFGCGNSQSLIMWP